MPAVRTKNELRCFCSRNPLLATYGLDDEGKMYVHVRIFKQRRIFGEVIARGGKLSLHCRECLRWHTVRFVEPHQAVLEEDTDPQPTGTDAPSPMLAPHAPDEVR